MQCACLAVQVEQAASPRTVERFARCTLPCSAEQSSDFLYGFQSKPINRASVELAERNGRFVHRGARQIASPDKVERDVAALKAKTPPRSMERSGSSLPAAHSLRRRLPAFPPFTARLVRARMAI